MKKAGLLLTIFLVSLIFLSLNIYATDCTGRSCGPGNICPNPCTISGVTGYTYCNNGVCDLSCGSWNPWCASGPSAACISSICTQSGKEVGDVYSSLGYQSQGTQAPVPVCDLEKTSCGTTGEAYYTITYTLWRDSLGNAYRDHCTIISGPTSCSSGQFCSRLAGDTCVSTVTCPLDQSVVKGGCTSGQNWVSIWPLTCIDNSIYITQVKQCTSPTCINPQTQSCSGTIYTCSTPQFYKNCSLSGQACSAGVCVGSSTNISTWTNLKGNIISTSQVGDTVRMLVSGSGFDLNQKINYTVYKNTTFLYFFKSVTPLSTILSSETWTSSETANSVFFKAKASLSESTSNYMDITSANNAMPVASIVSPDNLFRGSVNYSIIFTQNSSDEDDLLNITWNFGDNKNYSVVNYSLVGTPSLANTNHNYSSGGIYLVKLTVSEMNRLQSNSAYRTVYIFKPGINVIPVITSPVDGLVYTNWVKFNGSQSFVANCSQTMPGFNFTAGNLQCKYIHAPGTKITSGYNLTATWTVKDLDGSVVSGFPISGKWQQNYTQVVEFSKYFPNAARRSAYLTLDYEV